MAQPRVSPGERTQFVAFRVPESLLAAVDAIAAAGGKSRSDVIREGLAAHVQQCEGSPLVA